MLILFTALYASRSAEVIKWLNNSASGINNVHLLTHPVSNYHVIHVVPKHPLINIWH